METQTDANKRRALGQFSIPGPCTRSGCYCERRNFFIRTSPELIDVVWIKIQVTVIINEPRRRVRHSEMFSLPSEVFGLLATHEGRPARNLRCLSDNPREDQLGGSTHGRGWGHF